MKKFFWIGCIIIVGIAGIFAPTDLEKNDKVFDVHAWKRADSRTRGQMVGSFFDQKGLLNQKSIAEVEEMLGEPTMRGESFISYHIENGFLIEKVLPSKMYLIVEFDKTSGVFTGLTLADA